MQFAPIRIPLRRRLQTLAVLFVVFLGFFAHAVGLIIWGILFLSNFWPLSVLYATFFIIYDRDASSLGGRRSEYVRNLTIWEYFCEYFPISLIKTVELDTKKNYIFGYHPHGVMTTGAFGNFGTNATGFSDLFPGFKAHVLTLKLLFRFPFFRDLFMSFGMCDVSKDSIHHICTKKDGGNIAVIMVGGAAESLDARPGSCAITLKDRKGFIRMALETGAQLVPVYSFGENDVYTQPSNPRGSFLRRIQEKIRKKLTFAPIIFYGRGIFQYSFGLVPFRKEIKTVVGQPIRVFKRTRVTREDVDKLHGVYIRKLKELFDEHKKEFYPNAKLEIF